MTVESGDLQEESNERPRFAVLTHDHPFLHWDLLLETGSVCRTWRLLADPATLPVEAEAIGDHRPYYLTYEGPVSGDRGVVSRWDAGTYRVERRDEHRWVVELFGERLRGRIRLARDAHAAHWIVDELAK